MSPTPSRCLSSATLCIAAVWALPGLAEEQPFEHKIAPLLVRSCLRCHNASEAAGELDLSTRASAQKGGESSEPAIAPSKPGESYALARIQAGEMPPAGKGKPLTEAEIAALTDWIAAGAAWPDDRTLSPFEFTTGERAGRDWWALSPPMQPDVPAAEAGGWGRTPIDAFVLAELKRRGLQPSNEADRATLIRRATFDLWGLPPDPRDVAAFVADTAPDAYERLIDRLLASPHYGERWGQHWLDVARFAESNGYETNTARSNAWPYRDYVIDAINRDLPLPQFIREQLAGDRCGADVATAFLVAGAHDIVGSPDIELTRQQRQNDLDDIVSTTSQAFLALTVGCAKCHDHKFDPISQRDFYALQALVSGVQHGERDVRAAMSEEQRRELEERRKQLAEVERQLRALTVQNEPLARLNAPGANEKVEPRPSVHPLGNRDRFAPVKARFVRFTVLATNSAEPCLDELEVLAADDGRNVALAANGGKASASSVLAGGTIPIHQTAHVNDGRYGNSYSWIPAEPGAGWIQIELAEPATIDCVEWARDREGIYSDRLPTKYGIDVAEQANEWHTVATSEDRRPFSPQSPEPPKPAAAQTAEFERLTAEAQALRVKLQQANATKIYAGVFTAPEPIFRLHRGEVMQRRDEIAPGTPAAVGPVLQVAPGSSDSERREALARWLGDPKHPLTSRVFVNRLWHHHFGRGLVATPSDFGFNGGKPSHPALLDWLAAEFIAHDWKPKYLHRLIMLSSVYRQSSALRMEPAAIDGDNVWLWRFRPRRLDAESVHDTILSVAGTLDLTPGGPGYEVFEPNGNYVKVYTPKQSFTRAEWRRMVYQNKPRMRTDPTFGVFDCPDASQSMSRRNSSTTALQALNLLNSPFVVQQSQLWAERLERERPADVDAQISWAFELALARSPAADELAAARALAAAQGLSQVCRALLNTNEFVYVR